MPSDILRCLTNDSIFSAPPASDLFLSTRPRYFTGAEKWRESPCEDVFISPHLFSSHVETLWAVMAATLPPQGKIRGCTYRRVCVRVSEPEEVNNERYYPIVRIFFDTKFN